MSRIILLPAKDVSRDATVKSCVLPLSYAPGSYEAFQYPATLSYVPSLTYCLIRQLSRFPEQIHLARGFRLKYVTSEYDSTADILSALIPHLHEPDFTLSSVDPRLWATIIQLYNELPEYMRTYLIPLDDMHLTTLQTIPSTSHFSLCTILELPACPNLNDTNIHCLRDLHTLAALDISETSISVYGIHALAGNLRWVEDDGDEKQRKRGPWGLRILRLRNCRSVDNTAFSYLQKFPLLSAVDLRGTSCHSSKVPEGFSTSSSTIFYHPHPLSESLELLQKNLQPSLWSSDAPYIIHIESLRHIQTERPKAPSVTPEGGVFTFSSFQGSRFSTSTHSALPRRLQDGSPPLSSSEAASTSGASESQSMSVTQEIAAEASRAAAARIYAHPTKSEPARRRTNEYTAQRVYDSYEWKHQKERLHPLMIFRDPPPWSTLEDLEWIPPNDSHKQKQRVEAVAGRVLLDPRDPRVAKRKEMLAKYTTDLARRKTEDTIASTKETISNGLTQQASIRTSAPQAFRQNSAASSGSGRALRTVGSLPIPKLPQGEMERLKARSKAEVSGKPRKGTPIKTEQSQMTLPKMLKRMASDSSLQSKAPVVKQSRTSSQVTNSFKAKSFDWSGWSNK